MLGRSQRAALIWRSLAPAGMALVVLVAPRAAAEETREVVAGAKYKGGGTHRWILGADYREMWLTPFRAEVLDMQKEAGGLTAAFRVGGVQTKGLALVGKDGKNYTFRGIEKDNAGMLEEDLKGTVVEKLLDDQGAAQHPASELVVRGLSEAAGIPVPPWKLVVLPDDEALGKFRKDFAGAIGFFAEYPSAVTATNPGFRGVTEIVSHDVLYKKRETTPTEKADLRALLRARLLDLAIGDWDRHRKQWRWAKFPGSPLWTPIPEDRDQAFSRYEGVLLGIGRTQDPRLQVYTPEVKNLKGLTSNGREQDRRLLVPLTRDVFKEEAISLKAALTDEAIEKSVALLPEEWRKLTKLDITAALKARRDHLVETADKYYLELADKVDVYMTDLPELVEVQRQPSGDVDVTVAVMTEGRAGEPYYHRVFHPSETQELRLYALGGDDKIVVTGGRSNIKVRVIGGPGNDTLDDSQGGGSRLSDSQGSNKEVKGPGTSEDTRTYHPPPPDKNAPWIPPRDFGSDFLTVPWVSYGSDLGVFLGWGFTLQKYGFRKDPFAWQQTIRVGWSFGEENGKLEYQGFFRRENSRAFYGLTAFASGVEVLNFYGFGNETSNNGNNDFYKNHSDQYGLYPAYAWTLSKGTTFGIGPTLRYTTSEEGKDNFINQHVPYGFPTFGEVGARAIFLFDRRDSAQYPHKGGIVAVRGTVWPEVWDVKSTYGEVSGNANGYLSAGHVLTFAVRGGAKHVFGEYPYLDAAFLGGGGLITSEFQEPGFSLRGYERRRFAGDSAIYGNGDLRLELARINLLIPTHVGIFGLFDVGRVFLKGETSDTWHTDYGGGIWLSLLNYKATFSAYLAHSKESDIFHVGGGFGF
jgi:hypothetical protein